MVDSKKNALKSQSKQILQTADSSDINLNCLVNTLTSYLSLFNIYISRFKSSSKHIG